MTPLEKIEEGIIKKDWILIIGALKDLSGKDLSQYKNNKSNIDIQQIRKDINNVLDNYNNNVDNNKPNVNNSLQKSDCNINNNDNDDIELVTHTSLDKKVVFITEQINDEMKRRNEQYTKQRNKNIRLPPKTYKYICNECGNEFSSRTQCSEKKIQKCNNCIRNIIRSEKHV